jgi:hypothetical protein
MKQLYNENLVILIAYVAIYLTKWQDYKMWLNVNEDIPTIGETIRIVNHTCHINQCMLSLLYGIWLLPVWMRQYLMRLTWWQIMLYVIVHSNKSLLHTNNPYNSDSKSWEAEILQTVYTTWQHYFNMILIVWIILFCIKDIVSSELTSLLFDVSWILSNLCTEVAQNDIHWYPVVDKPLHILQLPSNSVFK